MYQYMKKIKSFNYGGNGKTVELQIKVSNSMEN